MTLRILTSFHYFRDVDMGQLVTELRDLYGGPVEVFADSGAFSAVTTGAPVHLGDYKAWLNDWDELFTVRATLDVIGDHKATAINTRELEDNGFKVLPTFHVGTPWPVLRELCARNDYLALGGMVPHSARRKAVMRWLIQAFKIAQETGTVFHGFGQTTYETVKNLPFYSVDSSSWSSAVRYGSLQLWDHHTHRLQALKTGRQADAQANALLIRLHGADPAAMGRDGFGRLSQRSKEQYREERIMTVGVSANAWQRYGAWLATRHKVPPPPGHVPTGTVLYLADLNPSNFRDAATYLGNLTRQKETSS